jgi:hypothetical protein
MVRRNVPGTRQVLGGRVGPNERLPPAGLGIDNRARPLSAQQRAAPKWTVDREHPEKDLCATVKAIARAQGNMSMYANTDFMSGTNGTSSNTMEPMPRMSYNMLKIGTDALAGMLVQSNARVTMLTASGDWDEYQKARKIEQAIEAEFRRGQLYPVASAIAIDGITTGTGWLKIYKDTYKKTVNFERVFPNEVFVDEVEAAYGAPTKMYQMRYVKKETLMALFPGKADIIDKAGVSTPPRFAWTVYQKGMVEVYEGWSITVGKVKGRHVMAIESGALVSEEWDEEFFPFVPFKPADMPLGWYGQGFIAQTFATQIELNKILNVMRLAAHYGIAPYWVIQEGASINIRHLNNQPGHIVETASQEPKWVTNPPFHPEATQYVQMLKSFISDYFGMNEMQTTGQLPVDRLDSKKALTAFIDTTNTRHQILLERWQQFFLDVAQRTMMLAGQLAKEFGSYPVLVKKSFQKASSLDWKDLSMPDDKYMMAPAAANLLSTTPAARINDIANLMEKGLISQEQGTRLMQGPPDINAVVNEVSAAEDDIDHLIEQFIEHNTYRAPSTLQNLPRALKRVKDAALEYANMGIPDANLEHFYRYLEEAKALLEQMQPNPQAAEVNSGTSINPAQPTLPGGTPAAAAGQAATAGPATAGQAPTA